MPGHKRDARRAARRHAPRAVQARERLLCAGTAECCIHTPSTKNRS